VFHYYSFFFIYFCDIGDSSQMHPFKTHPLLRDYLIKSTYSRFIVHLM